MPLGSNRLSNLVTGLPITRALQTGRIGSFYALVGVTINMADTTLTHALGRIPSGYLVFQAPHGGGVVYDGTLNGSDWSPSQIVLAASVAGIYTVLLA